MNWIITKVASEKEQSLINLDTIQRITVDPDFKSHSRLYFDRDQFVTIETSLKDLSKSVKVKGA